MRRILWVTAVVLVFISGCVSQKWDNHHYAHYGYFILTAASSDATYGYTQANAIKVGGGMGEGVRNEKKFLNALTGPEGQAVKYVRLGSCCSFKTPNGIIDGSGLLDKYEVSYKGLKKSAILYLNLYDSGEMQIPVGFKAKPGRE